MDIRLSKIKVVLPKTEKTLFQFSQLDVPFGSKVLIQGASGKGKTTLLHLMAGLFLPDEGHVYWGETCLDNLSEEERAQFRENNAALIFQKLNLIDHLTALENVELALPKNSKEKAGRALEKVGLQEKKSVLSTFLSLGEQQRVAVSRAIAQNAKVILADEPTSSLDEKNAFQVMDALFEASQEKSLVVVSHDHRITKRFDRVMQFEDFK
jgi:putative ABC transport system ATP-binding protein